MAPPELARDAPGLDVFHPVEISILPILWDELGLAVAHRGNRRLRQFLGVDVPLVGQERLDHHIRAIAVWNNVTVRFYLRDKTALFQPRDNLLARGEAINAFELLSLGKIARGLTRLLKLSL